MMIIRIIAIASLTILLAGCSSTGKKPAVNDASSFFPDSLAGFVRTGEVKIYPDDSLYNYIGEAADEYLTYGVLQIAACEYSKNDLTLSIDLYEFTNPLGAFGIYSSRRMPEDKYLQLGTEALLGNGFIYYLKDRYFVTINSYNKGLPDFESLTRFAIDLDSLIPGVALYPKEVAYFPKKRFVEHSDRFYPHGFEQFAAPESCFSAVYRRGDNTCILFFALNRTSKEYETLAKVIKSRALILTRSAGIGERSVYAVSDEDGKIMAGYSDGVIFGVLDVVNDYWARALCEALFENMGKEFKVK